MEPLDDVEVRVLGALLEKEATTPEQYPLTLNALVQACNQATSRDPVVVYEPATVERAVDGLKARGLARIVHPPAGQRATKYRQVADEVLRLDAAERAVLAVLALRGPQTAGELKTRTERQWTFADLAAVESTLVALAGREPPLLARLERQPGRRDARWAHLLQGEAGPPPAGDGPEPAEPAEPAERLGALEREVEFLRRDVAELRALLADLLDD